MAQQKQHSDTVEKFKTVWYAIVSKNPEPYLYISYQLGFFNSINGKC